MLVLVLDLDLTVLAGDLAADFVLEDGDFLTGAFLEVGAERKKLL